MYLEHFQLKEWPFSLTPNTDFYCSLPGHQAALNVLLVSLHNGEGFIKIIGEVGTGKTLLCRKLLNSLDSNFVTAYIPNPDLTPIGLRRALAQELGIPRPYPSNQHDLLDMITQQLLSLQAEGKRIVLLLDEAQAFSIESLEAIRLLTNLETKNAKLLQVVMFAQPELDQKLNLPHLRQLKQRVTFSHYLSHLQPQELEDYICHRLSNAGCTRSRLFSSKATKLLYSASRGIPRLVNILCHKALMVSYGRGENRVTHQAVQAAIKDTESITKNRWLIPGISIIATAISAIALGLTYHSLIR